MPTLIGEDFAQELIDYTDKIYLEFGADTKIEGIGTGDAIKEIRKNAIKAGLKLVDCPIRHLGCIIKYRNTLLTTVSICCFRQNVKILL